MWSVLVMVLMLAMLAPAVAVSAQASYQEIITSHNGAQFAYELFLTDQNGAAVANPRELNAGDTLYVEIELAREKYHESSYDSYGIEFRLLTRGLTYNNDGTSLRSATKIQRSTYMDGDSVGFAWYDMTREGESFANPVLAAHWSYTVDDPKAVNITVPVALIYLKGDNDAYIPVGTAKLFLDLNGGTLIGKDVSGEYPSGKAVILPDAKFGDYVFEGWSDGTRVYPAGTEYVVSGVVTLTAQWADLVRDRYINFILNGGEHEGEDLSGYYADGETIILPNAIREGYRLVGWSDGVDVYAPGDEYVVYNTVNLTAIWEAIDTDSTKGGSGCCIICGRDYWVIPVLSICWICLLILILILITILIEIWLIILLWKRSFIKYSLVNGDIALDYKNNKGDVQVEVVLIDDDREHSLNRSVTVKANESLRFIKNVQNLPVADVKPGKYKGKLIIEDGGATQTQKCRIEIVDRELKEKQ